MKTIVLDRSGAGPCQRGVGVVLMAFVLLAGSACAGETARTSSGGAPYAAASYPVFGPTPDWASPQPANTVRVSSVADAQEGLDFQVLTPSFGPPEEVFVSSDQTPRSERVLFLVYGLADRAPFWLVQLAAGPNWRDNFDEQVLECHPSPCQGLSVVTIRDSQRALLDVNDEMTVLLWREGALELRLVGPAATFSPSKAMDTAEAV